MPEHCGFLRKDILRQHFSDAELADLALTVSLWNALTRFQRVMGVESDRARPPRGTDPGERQHFPSVYRTQLWFATAWPRAGCFPAWPHGWHGNAP